MGNRLLTLGIPGPGRVPLRIPDCALWFPGGDAVDLGPQGLAVTFTGTTPTEDQYGRAGRARLHDAVDDLIGLGSPLSSPAAWTYVIWFRPDDSGSADGLIGQNGNPGIRWGQTANRVRAFMGTDTGNQIDPESGALSIGKWHHAAATVDVTDPENQVVTLYVDGALVAQETGAASVVGDVVRPSFVHQINQRDSTHGYLGATGSALIYARALTPQQHAALYRFRG